MSEFLASPLVLTLLVLLASVIGVVGGGLLTRSLLKKEQGYPFEAQIEEVLQRFAAKGVLAAYKVSEAQVDKLGKRLRGIDKKLVAMTLYDLLPDTIDVRLPGGEDVLKIPTAFVKSLVSEEDFANMIEGVFDELGDFLEDTQGRFGEEVEELLKGLE